MPSEAIRLRLLDLQGSQTDVPEMTEVSQNSASKSPDRLVPSPNLIEYEPDTGEPGAPSSEVSVTEPPVESGPDLLQVLSLMLSAPYPAPGATAVPTE